MRILLTEDNPRLSELLAQALRAEDFAVDTAFSLQQTNELLKLEKYDLILLDLSLPDGDGLSIIKQLSIQRKTIPILVITARSGLDDRITGLDLGADDYLVKPFATKELISRVRALLRRPGGALSTILVANNLSLNSSLRNVSIEGNIKNIPPKEMALLEHLMRHLGQVVTRQSLESGLYEMEKDVGPNALEACVSRLRRWLKLNDVEVHLHTSHGIGYALMLEGKPIDA